MAISHSRRLTADRELHRTAPQKQLPCQASPLLMLRLLVVCTICADTNLICRMESPDIKAFARSLPWVPAGFAKAPCIPASSAPECCPLKSSDDVVAHLRGC